MERRLKWFVFAVCTLPCVTFWTASQGWTQQESPQVPASAGKLAVNAVLKHYAVDPLALDPKTGQPLPTSGSWSIGKVPHSSCPQTNETCLEVFYQVAAESVRCSWVVLLNGDGTDGRFLDEDDDTERYMVLKVSPSEAKALVNTRKKPTFPPIAILAHVNGAVVLQVLVGKLGEVQKVAVLSGPAMEQQAAIDAAKKWNFKPMLVGARDQPYELQLVFTFRTIGPSSATVEVAP
jgi:TonB family protein